MRQQLWKLRREHWAWLGVFLLVSVLIHLIIGWTSRTLGGSPAPTPPGQLVITLLPPTPTPAKHVGLPAAKPSPRPQIARAVPHERRIRLAAAPRVPVAPRVHTARRVRVASQTIRRVAQAAPQIASHSRPVVVPDDQPEITPQPQAMRIAEAPPVPTPFSGGGSAAPNPLHVGSGGAQSPETPPDDVLWNGGGRGGDKLPKAPARAGGGGGLAFLSVRNPLGQIVPDDTPGAGPGAGGGLGAGHGGGMGFGRGHGVGMAWNGRRFAALRTASGLGLGAGRGAAQGTQPPRGDGTGAELPGTGGIGTGYGSGNGLGSTASFRPGSAAATDLGDADTPSGGASALDRGIPFGDIPGLLSGGAAGGGRGGISGGGGTLHMVYLLDVSGSMRVKNKTGKARDALKKALSELKRRDWFDIICFDAQTYPFAPAMQKATPANVARADAYIDAMPLDQHPGTNMSQALGTALAFPGATDVFLMSDGEPQWGGITDFTQLRQYVTQQNTRKIPIFTLALGVGERFKGMTLMRGIADDNGGTFHYINLSADTPTTALP